MAMNGHSVQAEIVEEKTDAATVLEAGANGNNGFGALDQAGWVLGRLTGMQSMLTSLTAFHYARLLY